MNYIKEYERILQTTKGSFVPLRAKINSEIRKCSKIDPLMASDLTLLLYNVKLLELQIDKHQDAIASNFSGKVKN